MSMTTQGFDEEEKERRLKIWARVAKETELQGHSRAERLFGS